MANEPLRGKRTVEVTQYKRKKGLGEIPQEATNMFTTRATSKYPMPPAFPTPEHCFALAVPSQKTEDFIHALNRCLQDFGGVLEKKAD